jgi:hypothetical protein
MLLARRSTSVYEVYAEEAFLALPGCAAQPAAIAAPSARPAPGRRLGFALALAALLLAATALPSGLRWLGNREAASPGLASGSSRAGARTRERAHRSRRDTAVPATRPTAAATRPRSQPRRTGHRLARHIRPSRMEDQAVHASASADDPAGAQARPAAALTRRAAGAGDAPPAAPAAPEFGFEG